MTKPNRLTTIARSTAAFVLLIATQPMAYAASSSATAACATSVNVVAPITIANTVAMSFGNIVPDASGTGTVVLSTAGLRTPTTVTLATAGSTAPGTFTVTGLSGAAYTVTLPASPAVLSLGGTPGADDMNVDGFNSDTTNVITGGSITLHVGATLHLAQAQTAGAYSGTFNVTVTYN